MVVFSPECSAAHPCEGLGIHAHFHNFGMAFLTLFRVATGDNWNGIMKVDIIYTDVIFCPMMDIFIKITFSNARSFYEEKLLV